MENFIKKKYGNLEYIFFHKDINFISDLGHDEKSSIQFQGYTELLRFKKDENIEIFIVKEGYNGLVNGYKIDGRKYFVEISKYINFYKLIIGGESSNGNKARAFFTREADVSKLITKEEREVFKSSLTNKEILEIIEKMDLERKKEIFSYLDSLEGIEKNIDINKLNISDSDLLNKINEKGNFLFYSDIKIKLLEESKIFLENMISNVKQEIKEDKNKKKNKITDDWETYFQNYLDGKKDYLGNEVGKMKQDEKNKIIQSRSLIFGLDTIHHKREKSTSGRRIDLFSKMGLSNDINDDYILIEFKSPKAKLLENKSKSDTPEYHLSSSISRAIPQILSYKREIENKQEGDTDLNGLATKGKRIKISKSIILIGFKENDDITWNEYFNDLKNGLKGSIEIWTYDDLVKKLDTVILNLKNNLQ